MSTPSSPSSAISQAFDRESAGYGARWDASPIVQIWRGRVLAALLTRIAPASTILDVGCGSGSDAVALIAAGHAVTAIDASPGMVAECRRRGVAAEVCTLADAPARFGPRFAAVLLDFGVLNCLPELRGFAAAIEGLVAPGGFVAAVWMSRSCPAETVARLRRGQRPRRGRPEAQVSGVAIPLTWWSSDEVARSLGPTWDIVHREAIGLLNPPPDVGGAPSRLTRWEPYFAGLPGLRDRGDHTLLILRRSL